MRIIKTFTALILLSAVTCTHAATFSYGYYNEKAKTCAITAYNGGDIETLTIPNNHKRGDNTYRVTAIADSVFIGLKKLRVVNIGPFIAKIGGIATKDAFCATNFLDCPRLAEFNVDPSNGTFMSDIPGILMSKGGIIYRVPPMIKANSGVLNISPQYHCAIADKSFNGVSTVTTLNLGPYVTVWQNAGFNESSSLAKINVSTGNSDLFVTKDGMLMSYLEDRCAIISLPPKSGVTELKIPTTVSPNGRKLAVTFILDEAFANCVALKSVTIPASVKWIRDRAFAGSGLTKVTIPATATDMGTLGKGIFAGCPALVSISINGNDMYIPADFARGCRKLTKVTLSSTPRYIGNNAFKNCTSLTSFPFNAETSMGGDSIFANTGFTKVLFARSEESHSENTGMFTGCRDLTTIDLSAAETVPMGKGFATKCPKLSTIIFPRQAAPLPQSFGINNALRKIVAHSLSVPKEGLFGYDQSASPYLYLATKGVGAAMSCDLGRIFKPSSGAKVTPRIYTDAFSLHDTDTGSPIKDATIYVPALASHNYHQYTKSSKVTEMFTLSITRSGSKTRIEYRPVISGIKFTSINLGDGNSIALNPDGAVKTVDLAFSKIKSVTLAYSVNGVKMLTRYPKNVFNDGQTAIDDVTGDMPSLRLEGRVAQFDAEVAYTVSDMHGRVAVSGHGSEADLSHLPAGVYIVRLPLAIHKILLR